LVVHYLTSHYLDKLEGFKEKREATKSVATWWVSGRAIFEGGFKVDL